MMSHLSSARSRNRRYADGGTINVDVAPSGGMAPSPSFTGANSSISAPTADQLAKYPTMPPATAIAQPALTPQPYANSITNVPVGGTSGAPTSPFIASIGANGIPTGSPPPPTSKAANSSLAPAVPPPSSTGAGAASGQTLYGGDPGAIEPLTQSGSSYSLNGQPYTGQMYNKSSTATDLGNVVGNQVLYFTPYTPPPPAPPAAGAKNGGRIQKMGMGGLPSSAQAAPWFTRQDARQAMGLHPEGLVRGLAGGRTDVHKISVPAGSYVMPADVVSGLAEGNTMAGSNVMSKMMTTGPGGLKLQRGVHGPGPPKAPHVSMPKQIFARGGEVGKATESMFAHHLNTTDTTGMWAPQVDMNLPPQRDVNKPQGENGNTLALTERENAKRAYGAPSDRGMARGGHTGELVPIIVAGGEHIIYPQSIVSKFGNLSQGHKILDKFVTTVRKKTIDEMKKLKGPKT